MGIHIGNFDPQISIRIPKLLCREFLEMNKRVDFQLAYPRFLTCELQVAVCVLSYVHAMPCPGRFLLIYPLMGSIAVLSLPCLQKCQTKVGFVFYEKWLFFCFVSFWVERNKFYITYDLFGKIKVHAYKQNGGHPSIQL